MISVEHYVHLEESSLNHLSVDYLVFADDFYRILFPRVRELRHVDPTKGTTAELLLENKVLEGDLFLGDRYAAFKQGGSALHVRTYLLTLLLIDTILIIFVLLII